MSAGKMSKSIFNKLIFFLLLTEYNISLQYWYFSQCFLFIYTHVMLVLSYSCVGTECPRAASCGVALQ